MLDTPDGEDLLKRLERLCDATGLNRGIKVVRDEPDVPRCPYEIMYRDGQRSMYWYLLTLVEQSREILKRGRKHGPRPSP